MKTLLLTVSLVSIVAIFSTAPIFAAEHYVVKSRSGILRVVDHIPKGRATIVKGPFNTSQEAGKAIGSAKDVKGPDASAK